ncbi:MAG: DNA primase [Candidatus Coatesbacteria bacterium]|nr:DNA primase [Candidatus Coatesbacteria bacterium]
MSSRRYVSQSVIDEVRERADIVQVLSSYLTLRPAGQNFKALCPFHKEKTPSFMVNPNRQMFRCFGCGEGGNVFTFLMKIDGLTFGEAVRTLARRYGVELKTEDGEEIDRGARLRQRLYDLNRRVGAHFMRNLVDNRIGGRALEYLKKRGVSDDAIRTFSIGYAQDSWDDLRSAFGKNAADVELMETAGLVSKRKQGGYYDRFRGRIIFPISDIAGNVCGFGGRVLGTGPGAALEPPSAEEVGAVHEPPFQEAKYLNSPESPVYHKGRTLYGLHQARDAVRSEGFLVLVEGYMDVIALFEAGVRNVAAMCGTALTPQQCGLIKRYTERVVVFFDADVAGTSASLRSFEVFDGEGLRPRVFKADGGADPDEYVKRVGGDELKKQLSEAPPFPEFLIDETLKRFDVASIEGKLSAMKDVLPLLSRLTEVERNHYGRMLADELSVNQEAVFAEMRKFSGGSKVAGESETLREREFVVEERDLVRLVAMDEEIQALACETVDPQLITSSFLRDILESCFSARRSGLEVTPSTLLDRFENESQRDFITQLAFCESIIDKKGFERLVDSLKRMSIMRQANRAHKDHLEAIPRGDSAKESELAKELIELKSRSANGVTSTTVGGCQSNLMSALRGRQGI